MSDAELLRELARRRLANGTMDLDSIESTAEEAQRDLGEETLAAAIEVLPPEDGRPVSCPKCGRPAAVNARNRLRHLLTTAGELRLRAVYRTVGAVHFDQALRDGRVRRPARTSHVMVPNAPRGVRQRQRSLSRVSPLNRACLSSI